jgi:CcmD family protein
LIISYGVLWVGLLAFIGYLGWRQRQLYDELDDLERRLEEIVDEPSIDE